jgi:NAD(P)-dependent dehydrogenase (short-subunit alcohol dehydrogenase family)
VLQKRLCPPRAPHRVLAAALDVTHPQEAAAAVQPAIARFGRIDVVINNAGHGVVGALEETPAHRIGASELTLSTIGPSRQQSLLRNHSQNAPKLHEDGRGQDGQKTKTTRIKDDRRTIEIQLPAKTGCQLSTP